MKRYFIKKDTFLVLGLFLIAGTILFRTSSAQAATITATSCSQSAVQTAINSATDGDTVSIPAGSCIWSGGVSWSNKNINVIGAGIDNTVITLTDAAFYVEVTTKAVFRISGMTLTGAPISNPWVIYINSSNTEEVMKGWRIDHIRFNFTNQTSLRAIMVDGITYGLIDHCTFDGGSYLGVHSRAYTQGDWNRGDPMGTKSWSLPLNLGTDEAVYIEDSTWNLVTSGLPFVNDMSFGARQVFRNNIINNGVFQVHSARGNDRGGAVKYEVYNNTWRGNGLYRIAHIRSGTGVLFNNTISGYENNNFDIDDQRASTESGCYEISSPLNRCDGSSSYDGNVESNGWPCLDQIGRGAGMPRNQPSVPLYAWNNGTLQTCATGGACDNSSLVKINSACMSSANWIRTTNSPHVGDIVDYINNGSTPKPAYTPYTYPHPLQGTSGDDTTPPTVSISSPASGVTVSDTVTVSANASDNVVVVGVQFKLDGTNLSTEDTTEPYSTTWDTTSATNGSHTLTAVARDAAGNTKASSDVIVTIENSVTPTAPTITQQPTDQTVTVGASAAFSVVAVGTEPLSYQWMKNGTIISGATNSTYNTPATTLGDSGGVYSVIVTNSVGSVTSRNASLAVTLAASGETLWSTTVPAAKGSDSTPWELGTIFSATTPGTITGVRLYAANDESGTHTARIWNNVTGSVVGGPYSFTAAGVGWVSYTLPSPVSITAGTPYTVSISTGADTTKVYAYTSGALTSAGTNGANLSYPANAGVFSSTVGTRPTESQNSTNYFRDVFFVPTAAQPTVTLSANPTALTQGQSSTLSWTSTNSTSCVGTGFITGNAVSGTAVVTPTNTTTYSISCTGAGGSATTDVTVSVTAPVITPPTYIGEYETSWDSNATPKTTTSFTAEAGDVLVAYAMTEDAGTSVAVSGGGLTWTQEQVVNTSGYGWLAIWTATVDSTKTISTTFTGIGSGYFGGNVLHFRNATVGASTKTTGTNGAPTLTIDTTQENSAIVVANIDWNAKDGVSRVWDTTTGPITEKTYSYSSMRYTTYGGYHANAGLVGTKKVGLSVPTEQKYSLAAVEVKGKGSVTPPPTPTTFFSDDFESSLSWNTQGDVLWYTGSPKNGAYSVRLRTTGSIEKVIPLNNQTNVSVSFKMGAYSLDGIENVQALYYNGTSWVELARIDNGAANENKKLNPYTVMLPSSVNNLATFALRFKLNGSGTGDYAYIDDISVTATDASILAHATASSALPRVTSALAVVAPLTEPLVPGMERPEVITLQRLLNQSPKTMLAAVGIGSLGNETSYFGSLTTKAVQKFQSLHNIVSTGTPSTTGFGRVGPKTLAKLKELFGL